MTDATVVYPPARRRRRQRLAFIVVAGIVLFSAAGLITYAARQALTFSYFPSDFVSAGIAPGTRVRVMGRVMQGSFVKTSGTEVAFTLSDTQAQVRVVYGGILPDLFREGQGVVVEGALRREGVFHATTVLAKHDERVMPRGLVDKIKESGDWKGE